MMNEPHNDGSMNDGRDTMLHPDAAKLRTEYLNNTETLKKLCEAIYNLFDDSEIANSVSTYNLDWISEPDQQPQALVVQLSSNPSPLFPFTTLHVVRIRETTGPMAHGIGVGNIPNYSNYKIKEDGEIDGIASYGDTFYKDSTGVQKIVISVLEAILREYSPHPSTTEATGIQ